MRTHVRRFWPVAALLWLGVVIAGGALAVGMIPWPAIPIRWSGLAREFGIMLAPLLVIFGVSLLLLLACLEFGPGTLPKGDLERLMSLKSGGSLPRRSHRGRGVGATFVRNASIAGRSTGAGAASLPPTNDSLERLLRLKQHGA